MVSSYFKADGTIQIALNFTGLGPRCQTSFDRQIKQQDRDRQEHTGRKQTVFYHRIRKAKTDRLQFPHMLYHSGCSSWPRSFIKKVKDNNRDGYQTNVIWISL